MSKQKNKNMEQLKQNAITVNNILEKYKSLLKRLNLSRGDIK